MKIFVNSKDFKNTKNREIVEADLVKKFQTTFLVRLRDGNIILRKMNRDLPEGEVL